MNITDETAPVPAWLNLDEVVPPELRERAKTLSDKVLALRDVLTPIMRDYFATIADYEAALKGVPSDLWEYLWEVSGYQALDRVVLYVLGTNGEDVVTSEGLKALDERFGPSPWTRPEVDQ